MMKRRIAEFLVLLTVALGAGPVGAAIWQWSTTAGSNATADPSINWSEGMSPSSVNDSARAMMAALAGWRNDISAAATTAGSGTAYTLTSSEGLDTTPATGQMLAFIAHATNGAAATLAVDGGTAFPLQSAAGTALPAASLIAGTPYRATFNGSAWLMEGGYGNPYSVPLGAFLHSTVATPPNSNFIVPIGQCISTTTYAAYWAAIGSPASGACAGGQFAVVDVRGRNLTALDTLSASAANRLTNVATGCGVDFTTMGVSCLTANSSQSKTLVTANLPPYTPSGITVTSTISNVLRTNSLTQIIVSTGSSSLVAPDTGSSGTSPITSTGSGNPQGGTSTPLPTLDPNLGVYVFLRVL